MSNELQAYTTTGLTAYAVLINGAGQVWNGSAFVTINTANWTSYDIALTEGGAGIYLGAMPAAAAGDYAYVVYEQAGASPAITDTVKGNGHIAWSGSAEIEDADIADNVADEAYDGTTTLRQTVRLINAFIASKVSGGRSTTITYRNIDDTKNRIVATVDSSGNRTALTLDKD